MNYTKEIKWILLCVLFLSSNICFSKNTTPSYEITAKVDLGQIKAESYGTLFITKPTPEGIVCGAGFINSEHSRTAANQNDLEFWCSNINKPLKFNFKNYGKLNPHIMRAVVANYHGKLINYRGDPQHNAAAIYVGPGKGPDAWKRFTPYSIPYLMRYQKVANGDIFFAWHGKKTSDFTVYHNGQEIGHFDQNVSTAYFYKNRIYINVSHKILSCPFDPRTDKIIQKCKKINIPDSVWTYSFFPWHNSLYTGIAGSKIYRISDDKAENIYGSGVHHGGEFYSYIVYNNSLLLGHYPSGFVFKITPDNKVKGLEGFPATDPLDYHDFDDKDTIDFRYQELQSLSIVNGMLIAGIYPWGTLRWLDHQNHWNNTRIFMRPRKDPRVISPFSSQIIAYDLLHGYFKRITVNGIVRIQLAHKVFKDRTLNIFPTAWGQRITSIAVFNNKICVGTGNMSGDGYSEKNTPFITPKVAEQYGTVYCAALQNHTLAHIKFKPNTTLKFVIKNHTIEILQDGKLLAENKFTLPASKLKLPTRFAHKGDGIYGDFLGKLKQLKVMDRLSYNFSR